MDYRYCPTEEMTADMLTETLEKINGKQMWTDYVVKCECHYR